MKGKIIALVTLAALFSGCGEETKEAVKHDTNKIAEEVSKTVSPQLDKLSEQSKDIINSVKKTIDEKAPQVTKIVEDTVKQVKDSETPVHSFDGNNSVLGAACGKPFPASAVAILDGGKSDVLTLKAD